MIRILMLYTAVFFILVYLKVSASYSMLNKLHVRTKKCPLLTSQWLHFFACGWRHSDKGKRRSKCFLSDRRTRNCSSNNCCSM